MFDEWWLIVRLEQLLCLHFVCKRPRNANGDSEFYANFNMYPNTFSQYTFPAARNAQTHIITAKYNRHTNRSQLLFYGQRKNNNHRTRFWKTFDDTQPFADQKSSCAHIYVLRFHLSIYGSCSSHTQSDSQAQLDAKYSNRKFRKFRSKCSKCGTKFPASKHRH